MSWRPLQPNHAIERVRIIVRFGTPLSTKFIKSVAADNEARRLSLGFTSKNVRQGQKITMGPNGVSVGSEPSDVVGWDWQRLTAGNTPIETLVFDHEAVVYETAEYISWAVFFERFKEVAEQIVKEALRIVDPTAMSVEYGDRFIFAGKPQDASADFVLSKISALLPDEVAAGKSVWHVHRGWFEDLDGNQVLVNQNLDAQEGSFNGSDTRSVQINTKVELRKGESALEYDALMKCLPAMHDRSNALFKSVLTKDMLKRIGLGEEIIGGNDGGSRR